MKKPVGRRVFDANSKVYSVRKVWQQMQRKGFEIARCTVERLMRDLGLQGVIRCKPVKTTVGDKTPPCPFDQVSHQFQAPAPTMVLVSGGTYVATWAGFVYVAFVIDVCAHYIVGWRVSRSALASLVVNGLAQAIYNRRPVYRGGLIDRRGPWRSFEAVEYATLEWVDWFRNRRLLAHIGNISPAEAEERYCAVLDDAPMAA